MITTYTVNQDQRHGGWGGGEWERKPSPPTPAQVSDFLANVLQLITHAKNESLH